MLICIIIIKSRKYLNFSLKSVAEFLVKIFEEYIEIYSTKKNEKNINRLNILIKLTSALIRSNESIFLETTLINKSSENSEHSISDSLVKINPLIYNEFDPKIENEIIYKLISKNFSLIDKYLNMNKLKQEQKNNEHNNPDCKSNNIHDLDFPLTLHFSLLHFLKNFCSVFFNKNISLQYSSIFCMLSDYLKLESSSELIIFIFKFLIESFTKTKLPQDQKNKAMIEIKKIFEILIDKSYICFEYNNLKNSDSNALNSLFIGNIMINQDCLRKIINFHLDLNFLDPVNFYKIRKLFYSTLIRLLILNSNNPNNEEEGFIIYMQLIDHYTLSINEYSNKLKNEAEIECASNNLLGLIIDSIGILQKIDRRSNYSYFIKKFILCFDNIIQFYSIYRYISFLQNTMLKFVSQLTKNSYSRIDFHGDLSTTIYQNKYFLCFLI